MLHNNFHTAAFICDSIGRILLFFCRCLQCRKKIQKYESKKKLDKKAEQEERERELVALLKASSQVELTPKASFLPIEALTGNWTVDSLTFTLAPNTIQTIKVIVYIKALGPADGNRLVDIRTTRCRVGESKNKEVCKVINMQYTFFDDKDTLRLYNANLLPKPTTDAPDEDLDDDHPLELDHYDARSEDSISMTSSHKKSRSPSPWPHGRDTILAEGERQLDRYAFTLSVKPQHRFASDDLFGLTMFRNQSTVVFGLRSQLQQEASFHVSLHGPPEFLARVDILVQTDDDDLPLVTTFKTIRSQMVSRQPAPASKIAHLAVVTLGPLESCRLVWTWQQSADISPFLDLMGSLRVLVNTAAVQSPDVSIPCRVCTATSSLKAVPDLLDFGSVDSDARVITFSITNTDGAPVRLALFQPGNAIFVLEESAQEIELLPAETRSFRVTCNTGREQSCSGWITSVLWVHDVTRDSTFKVRYDLI